MEWKGRRESDNVEDREDEPDQGVPDDGGGMPGYDGGMPGDEGPPGGFRGMPGFPGMPGMPGRPIFIGGGLGTLILIVAFMFLAGNQFGFVQPPANQPGPMPGPQAPHREGPHRPAPQPPLPGAQAERNDPERHNPAHEELKHFVRVVLADTEDVWDQAFREMGKTYRKPKLVLYAKHTRAGCGFADAASGPFYCPADETIYLDLEFFAELKNRFHAPGEFAQAYVIAHEVGHHVQKLLGTMGKVDAKKARLNEAQANRLSVKLELQADFLAGVWANRADKMKHLIEAGDVEAAISAANAIGDDTLQKQSQGYAVPDSFTHGTSSQRIHWFRRGLQTGDIKQGNTFGAGDL
ncbi:MAG: zinc metallopeptidase [Planctomycetia bacterium]|nr:zinc metallopeptidase [Planctomycetia bacterium]